jgi:hypothetical protein
MFKIKIVQIRKMFKSKIGQIPKCSNFKNSILKLFKFKIVQIQNLFKFKNMFKFKKQK